MTTELNEADCGNGTLRELAKEDWGQLTLRTIKPGCEAGGHRHPNTEEVWWVVSGRAIVLLDGIPQQSSDLIRVGAGVRHSICNIGTDDVVLVYWADKWYEEQEKID